MQYLYVDPSDDANKPIPSAFKTVTEAIAAITSYPFSILIRRGTILKEAVNARLVNTSPEMCFIDSYGSGPATKWISASTTVGQIRSWNARKLTIQNIHFIDREDGYASTASPVNLECSGDSNGIADVHVKNCYFTGNNFSVSNPQKNMVGRHVELRAVAYDNPDTPAHKLSVEDCMFNMVNAGIYIRGNTYAADTTDNRGDGSRTYGAKVLRCSFTNVVQEGVLMHTCASKNDAYTDDEWQSCVRDCYYSSYRWDKFSTSGAATYDAPFWMWHCNRVLFEKLEVHGSYPMAPDNMAVDIDGMCWDNVVRYVYSTGCARTVMFVSADNAGLQAAPPAGMSNFEFYYTRRQGSGNNVVEYCFAFNDGIQRLQGQVGTLTNDACSISHHRNQFNNTVRNCVFIDTTSVRQRRLISTNGYDTESASVPSLTVENCIFYCKWMVGSDIIAQLSTGTRTIASASQIVLNNNIIWSDAWSAAPDLSALATLSGNVWAKPQYALLPSSPPSTRRGAINLGIPANAKEVGKSNLLLDINGRSGNNIGWLH
ncbi:TPA: hypothetical protein MEC06_003969 [Klebsiella pneumoniae]|uniref:hypothetical protein n=1 Tax=Klebsiella pneumoniae TaxID=573 RepID=UPI000E34E224|nr:hypothetical protein [Klebsiella pneumoniae]ELB6486145.1 hypothetical protein [Raoultella ornithinolytica]HBW0304348.1 hypothetical protein [Klebsiella pneumoniae]HBW0834432.1 hypothetical protein [Klebsiella pneumoniae]